VQGRDVCSKKWVYVLKAVMCAQGKGYMCSRMWVYVLKERGICAQGGDISALEVVMGSKMW
jgi:hypothetical protein